MSYIQISSTVCRLLLEVWSSFIKTTATILLFVSFVWTMPVYADGLLEEITVTARKRDESLQDIPITVNAFSGELLSQLGAKESGDVAFYTPNFTWNTEFGRATPQPFLRGVGSNGFMPNNTSPIAVYSDHVYIGPNIAQGFAAFDIERVEVLKGPQGTLYGRNATAGLINFISRTPEIGDGVEGFVRAEVGRFDTFNTEGAFETDLSDRAAIRLSLTTNRNDGVYDNRTLGGRSGEIDDIAGRVQLRYQPSDNLDVLLNGHFGRADPDVTPFKAVGTICPPGVTVPTLGVCTAGGGTDTANLHEVFSGPTEESVDTTGGFVKIVYDTGNYEITSISAYENSELNRLDDVDDLAVFQEYDHFQDEFDTFSQELRISGNTDTINWHVGGFYYNEDYEGEIFADFVVGSVGNIKNFDTESYAVFGQVEYNTDRWGASLGLRWTHEEKEHDYTATFNTGNLGANFFGGHENAAITTLASASVSVERDFDNLSGRFSLHYNIAADSLIYASYSRGFKAGDANGVAFGTTTAELAVQAAITAPEKLDAFEVGFKSTLADGKVRLNAAAFYYIYKDQQQSILLPVPGFPVPVTTFSNAAKSKIPGVEFDITWQATDRLSFLGNFGYVDAEYDEYVSNPTATDPALRGDFSGNRVPLTHEFEATGLASYEFPLSSGATVRLQGDVHYQSDNFFQPTNEPGLSEDSVVVFNGRLAYVSADETLEIALTAKNIGDKEYTVAGFNFDVPGIDSLHVKPNTPRYFAASIQYNF